MGFGAIGVIGLSFPMLCVGMPFWMLCILFYSGSRRGAFGDTLPIQSVGTMRIKTTHRSETCLPGITSLSSGLT